MQTFVYAQGQLGSATFRSIFQRLTELMVDIVPVLMAAATVVFIVGVIKFIMAADNPDKRNKAKDLIVWGLVGLFILVAFWGFVNILLYTLFGGVPAMPSNFPPRFF